MTQDIRDFVTPSCELLGLGEPTHLEPAFAWLRNDLFARLAEGGFRSFALETDRVAAQTVDDFVRHGRGALDEVMATGFSHGWGAFAANRALVAWMREHNEGRPEGERLAFHGFDAATETMTAPSPRTYLEHARDYLGADLDIAGLAGEDDRWERTEAILDPAQSIGDTPAAEKLRTIADDLLTELYARAPELIAATSRVDWYRARTVLTAGLGLLRYHKQSAQRIDETTRVSRLLATRDALMAQNLLEIRALEQDRGPTLVYAQNRHLQRNPSTMAMGGMDLEWHCAGEIVSPFLGDRYVFIAGSLGRSEKLGLGEPAPGTYEAALQQRFPAWGLTDSVPAADERTDTKPEQGYFPLDREFLAGADAVLHVPDGNSVVPAEAGR